jgi:hypothetical protein
VRTEHTFFEAADLHLRVAQLARSPLNFPDLQIKVSFEAVQAFRAIATRKERHLLAQTTEGSRGPECVSRSALSPVAIFRTAGDTT